VFLPDLSATKDGIPSILIPCCARSVTDTGQKITYCGGLLTFVDLSEGSRTDFLYDFEAPLQDVLSFGQHLNTIIPSLLFINKVIKINPGFWGFGVLGF